MRKERTNRKSKGRGRGSEVKRWDGKIKSSKTSSPFMKYGFPLSYRIVCVCVSSFSEHGTQIEAMKRSKMQIPVSLQHKSDSSFVHFRFALIIFQFEWLCVWMGMLSRELYDFNAYANASVFRRHRALGMKIIRLSTRESKADTVYGWISQWTHLVLMTSSTE